MSNSPELDALVQRQIDKVAADWEKRYGPALREYVFGGEYDPILAEIGYSGREYPKSDFGGLSELLKDT